MKPRSTLLMLLSVAAGASVLANAVSAADPAPQETRLGASIRQDFAQRDQEAARRKRELDMREQAARAAEQRLQAATGQQQGRPGGTAPADPNEERYSELARIYQAMRPKPAAAVLEQLEMEVQVQVARRMRERSTASILANMSPKGAAALTMAMARLPQT